MKLYTFPITANALKIELVINALGLEPELHLIELHKGQHRMPEFKALNPNGTIPVIEDEGRIIWESNAILIYLVKKYQPDIYRASVADETELLRWLSWQQGSWMKATAAFAHQSVVLPVMGGTTDKARVLEILPEFRLQAAILSQHLSDRDYILGEALSVADVALAAPLFYWREADIPVPEFAHLHQWMERLEGYDWWKQTKLQQASFINKNMYIHNGGKDEN